MKLYYYQDKVPNFGDDLSPWLMPKIFQDFFDNDEAVLFLAIGSIIFDHLPLQARKIVFGSGYGAYTKLPDLSANWTFYGVRGPRTAKACGLPASMVLGDTAILINKYRSPARPPGHGIAFMPHFNSLARGHWAEACAIAGLRLINPTAPVPQVLQEIESCEVLLAEAMHGAIVADALRVPWIPMLPIHRSHRMKWFDWAEALEMDLKRHRLWPSSLREASVALTGRGERCFIRNEAQHIQRGIQAADRGFIRLAAYRLKHLATMPPMLSSDTALARALERLEAGAARIKDDFATGRVRL
jgi:succinoglycan biosynthesis protein ExoV